MTTSHAPPPLETALDVTAVTRHLCAGVYVDERFRDLVIDEVCTAPHRRVAPSYGFDIVPVMHHAWRAAALSALPRLTVLAAVVGPVLTGAIPVAILVASGFSLLLLARLVVVLRGIDQTVPAQASKRRSRGPLRAHRYLLRFLFPRVITRKAFAVKRVAVAATWLALTILVTAFIFPRQGVMALFMAAAITLVYLTTGAARQLILNRILRTPALRPTRLSGRQRAADRQQRHMCAVYRRPRHADDEDNDDLTMFTLFGDESPFVGAGELVYQWNPPMSIQLLRPDTDEGPLHEREHSVPPFQAHELVDYLREAVLPLNADSQDVRLPAEVQDRVYVAETDVAVDRSLLPHHFTRDELRTIINTPESKQHHFLEVTTPADGSEFVATVLLRVSLQGRTLSLSTAACVLAYSHTHHARSSESKSSAITAP